VLGCGARTALPVEHRDSGPGGLSGNAGSSGASPGSVCESGGSSFVNLPSSDRIKVDVLFDIDNSVSMGDKQYFLAQAIPDLVDRLVNPSCVDATTLAVVGKSTAGTGCPAGSAPEFPAVQDMHIGIVSSALGPRLSEMDATGTTGVCYDPQQAQPPFQG